MELALDSAEFERLSKRELKQVGWSKGLELAKLARRRDGQEFDCATWLHKAREMPKEQFQREVEKELTGRETEAREIIYFKLYKSQIPVVEQVLETAALMPGSDKSRGYCLEMICADFLAGAHLTDGDPDVLLRALSTSCLPTSSKHSFKLSMSRSTETRPMETGSTQADEITHVCHPLLAQRQRRHRAGIVRQTRRFSLLSPVRRDSMASKRRPAVGLWVVLVLVLAEVGQMQGQNTQQVTK